MSTTEVGNGAEQAVAEELVRLGYVIVDRNWKTKWCEVDVIAKKDGVIWFIEVKYRKSDSFGDGLEYIGSSKLKHLQTAAALWVSQQRYGGEYTLGAASVSGRNVVEEFLEIL